MSAATLDRSSAQPSAQPSARPDIQPDIRPDTRSQLLQLLASGKPQSGEQLAEQLNVSRAAVWKQITALREMGLEVDSRAGQGYSLKQAFEPLNEQKIAARMQASLSTLAASDSPECDVDIHATLGSTNTELLSRGLAANEQAHACLAELQTDGRGRRGRQWLSPPGSGLCLSLAWRFHQLPASPGSLSLAVGVWVVNALKQLGVEGVQLKWPNDLYAKVDGRLSKLGGILVELQGEMAGEALVVIGIGLNHRLPLETAKSLDRDVTDLVTLVQSGCGQQQVPRRNDVASEILAHCLSGLPIFAQSGFAPWHQQWQALDMFANQSVQLNGALIAGGTARGVAEDGALVVENMGQLHRVVAGEISLQAAI